MKFFKPVLVLLCIVLFNPFLPAVNGKENKPIKKNADTPKSFFGYINLAGTVMFPQGDKRLNQAIFADEFRKKRFVYYEGDMLPYGVTLDKIEQNKVTLEKEGQILVLSLGEKISYSQDINSLKADGYRKLSDGEWTVNSHHLFTSNYDVIKMVTKSGLTMSKGVKISKPAGKLTGLGFKKGDKVTAINGVSLDGMLDLVSAYKEMKNSENITINILRDGKVVKQNYWVIKKGSPRYNMKQVLASDEIKNLL